MFYERNQLQFNLNVPATQQNVAARFHKPGPIIIDRAGLGPPGASLQGIAPGALSEQAPHNLSGMSFTSLSEDRLSNAVRLAQRDMRKRREEEANQDYVRKTQKGVKTTVNIKGRSRDRSPKFGSSRTRTKIVHGKEYWDRQKRITDRSLQSTRVRETQKGMTSRPVRTQTPPRNQHYAGENFQDPSFPGKLEQYDILLLYTQ